MATKNAAGRALERGKARRNVVRGNGQHFDNASSENSRAARTQKQISGTPTAPGPSVCAKSLPNTVSGRKRRLSEASDDHPAIVATLDARTRVIECAAGIQWIIQRRVNGGRHPWQSQYFCRTKAGLLLCGPKPTAPELLGLPDRFPERRAEWIDWPTEEAALHGLCS